MLLKKFFLIFLNRKSLYHFEKLDPFFFEEMDIGGSAYLSQKKNEGKRISTFFRKIRVLSISIALIPCERKLLLNWIPRLCFCAIREKAFVLGKLCRREIVWEDRGKRIFQRTDERTILCLYPVRSFCPIFILLLHSFT